MENKISEGPTTILTISISKEGAEKLQEPGSLEKLNLILAEANLPPVISIRSAEKAATDSN